MSGGSRSSSQPTKFRPMSTTYAPGAILRDRDREIVSMMRFGSTICAAVVTCGGSKTVAACQPESSN